MTSLQDYIDRQPDPRAKELLRENHTSALDKQVIRCICGLRRSINHAYRCLYCGVWLCPWCAEEHFGKTVKQHVEEKDKLCQSDSRTVIASDGSKL